MGSGGRLLPFFSEQLAQDRSLCVEVWILLRTAADEENVRNSFFRLLAALLAPVEQLVRRPAMRMAVRIAVVCLVYVYATLLL
jgi:hypothetical protein